MRNTGTTCPQALSYMVWRHFTYGEVVKYSWMIYVCNHDPRSLHMFLLVLPKINDFPVLREHPTPFFVSLIFRLHGSVYGVSGRPLFSFIEREGSFRSLQFVVRINNYRSKISKLNLISVQVNHSCIGSSCFDLRCPFKIVQTLQPSET